MALRPEWIPEGIMNTTPIAPPAPTAHDISRSPAYYVVRGTWTHPSDERGINTYTRWFPRPEHNTNLALDVRARAIEHAIETWTAATSTGYGTGYFCVHEVIVDLDAPEGSYPYETYEMFAVGIFCADGDVPEMNHRMAR